MKLTIRPPHFDDQEAFLAAVRASREHLHPFVSPPDTPDDYQAYCRKHQSETHQGRLLFLSETKELVGVININEIIRGCAQFAYIGYYNFMPHVGKGYMTRGLRAVLDECFGPMKLHRLEANIQPGNSPSINLVKRAGFVKEGFSEGYLKIEGQWRDHERWAIRSEIYHRPRNENPGTIT